MSVSLVMLPVALALRGEITTTLGRSPVTFRPGGSETSPYTVEIGNAPDLRGTFEQLSRVDEAYKQGVQSAALATLQRVALEAGASRASAHVPEGHAFPAAGQPPAGAEALQSLLEEMAGDWLHVTPDIPARKERNARERMKIPADEAVLALSDTTVFRSGKEGVVVAARGVYWRNSAIDGGNENGQVARMRGLVTFGRVAARGRLVDF
jgi:hypothetical protein